MKRGETHVVDERISFSAGEVDGRELGEEGGRSEDRGDVVVGVEVGSVARADVEEGHRATLQNGSASSPRPRKRESLPSGEK